MLFFFYGTDTTKSRAKAHEVLDVMKKKRPLAEFLRITVDNWQAGEFENYIGSQGLFEAKSIIFADGILENPEAKDLFSSRLKEISSSDNGFVFLEKRLEVALARKVESAGGKVEKFDLAKGMGKTEPGYGRGQEFNIFSLADALGRRSNKDLWVLYRQAIDNRVPPEEINGVLFWQLKSIALAKNAKNAAEAGLSPFVYSKAKRFAENFSDEDIRELSRKLVTIYHESRRGMHDFETALESLILQI